MWILLEEYFVDLRQREIQDLANIYFVTNKYKISNLTCKQTKYT